MTSSNELKQLDEDLAAGRLTHDEYVRRRNELQPDVEQTDRSSSSSGPANESPPASPFPPAFRWEPSPPDESTQVIRPVTPDSGTGQGGDPGQGGDMSETTQIVPKLDEQDSERTQVVQARPQPPPSYSSVHQAPPDAYQEPPDRDWTSYPVDTSAPPWAVSDLPPVDDQPAGKQSFPDQQSGWMRQGPEFEAPAAPPKTKQIVGIVLVAVLVLALVGAGVAYVISQDSADQAGGTNQPAPQEQQPPQELPAPPPAGPRPPDTMQALIEPPGQLRAGGGLFDLPQLLSDPKGLPANVVSALSSAGMTDGVLKASTRVESTIGMFAFTVRDEQAAIDVKRAIVDEQHGLQQDQSRAQQGVTVLGTAEDSPSTTYRAVYVLYDRVILLEVFGSARNGVLANFDSLLEEQVNYAPPTVRP
ncbi:MAG TPA: hypothetical protein VHH34_03860 [Pseudonocardiaceae bacterium]|nr:hypothetical protein [Pseudonocardiaceae bacterium]